jgi:beta-galactosidase
MPAVTHDGRSFMIDGRRIWLVSGRIPYARLPRETWGDRIHAAKLAGLNTIETPVFWNRHEPRPGKFDFTGDNDLRHFIDRVGKAGLYCVLSIGPFIDSVWDFGGLPAWLRENSQANLRTTGGPYLEACSRFITAVADQVRGWQVTAQGTGGPIVLLQCESEWTCGLDTLGHMYLGELTRYIREAGLSVPIVNSNNLWQGVEGQIDGWSGSEDLLATMRQLTSVRPTQPRVVIDLPLAHPTVWGKEPPAPIAPWAVQRRLAEVLAGAGQFNISTFAGGTNFAFFAGRSPEAPDAFVTNAADNGAVITAAGAHGPAYNAVRRIAHFASRFGRLFSNLDPAYQPVAIKPAEPEADAPAPKKPRPAATAPAVSVMHAFGPQGGVAFVFGDPAGDDKRPVTLLLPDGSAIPVPFGEQSLVWCLFNTNISPRSRLDYSNLCALGSVGQTLVCFGPAGATAMLSVNGSPVEATVPEGMTPVILEHEGLSIIIVSEDAVDSTFIADDAAYVGVSGLTADGAPIALAGAKTATRIGADGTHKTFTPDQPPRPRPAEKPTLAHWTAASTADYADGTSARYAAIDGPADLTTLGSHNGYGWYRISFKSDTRRAHLIFPFAGDRLHLFSGGKLVALVGAGPGADPDANIALHKGPQQLIILAENFGRFSGGCNLGEGKGLFGHIYEAEAIKAGKPKTVTAAPLDLLTFRSPLWEVSEGDATSPDRLTWTIQHRKRTPIVVRIARPPSSGLLVLDDKPIAYLDRSGPTQIFLNEDQLSRGNNVFQIAVMPHISDDELKQVAGSVEFFDAAEPFTQNAEMSFAKWEPPPAGAYTNKKPAGAGPTWWRSTFTLDKPDPHHPLHLSLEGMTKGQAYINGKHLGRYFVATENGKPVPPQHSYLIPLSWLKTGEEANEVVLFDEHGGNPAQVRLKH